MQGQRWQYMYAALVDPSVYLPYIQARLLLIKSFFYPRRCDANLSGVPVKGGSIIPVPPAGGRPLVDSHNACCGFQAQGGRSPTHHVHVPQQPHVGQVSSCSVQCGSSNLSSWISILHYPHRDYLNGRQQHIFIQRLSLHIVICDTFLELTSNVN